MGCSVSRLEQGDDEAPGPLGPIRRKIEEVKRNRRRAGRKDSIVSTTELLTPEDMEVIDDDVVIVPSTKSQDSDVDALPPPTPPPHMPPAVVPEVGQEDKKLGEDEEEKKQHEQRDDKGERETEEEEVEEEKGRMLVHDDDDDDELPGSPSFRVYFVDDSDKADDSVKHGGAGSRYDEDEDGNKGGANLSNHEEHEGKPAKTWIGKRFRVLSKRPAFFNIRSSCYSHNQANLVSSHHDDLRRPLSQNPPPSR